MKTILILLCAVLLLGSFAYAQAPTSVQNSPTLLNGCQAANSTGAAGAATTLTITPPNGFSVYLCGWDISVSANNTGTTVMTLASWTSTNLGGWAWKMSFIGTANTTLFQPFYFTYPVKSTTPGTAVTIVSPTLGTNNAYSINAYYYVAP